MRHAAEKIAEQHGLNAAEVLKQAELLLREAGE
jgi:hypothetical protein